VRQPTYDSFVHLLAEHYAGTLLGLAGVVPVGPLRRVDPTLAAEILTADCVWVVGGELVQIEFESYLRADIGWRLQEYRGRLRMRTEHRGRRLRQHVLVLGDGSPPGMSRCREAEVEVVHRDHGEALLHYRVVLVRNIDPEALLVDPVTAVLAPLGCCGARHRLDVVRRAIAVIRDGCVDDREVERLAACLRGFAGFRIDDTDTIDSVLVRELRMPIEWKRSSTVGPLLVEAEERGEARGEARGQARGEARGEARGRVLGMLDTLFGPDPRIDNDLAERLIGLPDLARRARQAPTLDHLLRELSPGGGD
jgi:hypothetical protein